MHYHFENKLNEEQKLACQTIPDFCGLHMEQHGELYRVGASITSIGEANGKEYVIICPHKRFEYIFYCYKRDEQNCVYELRSYREIEK